MDCIVHGITESDMTEQLSLSLNVGRWGCRHLPGGDWFLLGVF